MSHTQEGIGFQSFSAKNKTKSLKTEQHTKHREQRRRVCPSGSDGKASKE